MDEQNWVFIIIHMLCPQSFKIQLQQIQNGGLLLIVISEKKVI